MVGYMSLEEQVDADFTQARRRVFLRHISARLRKGPIPNRLPCFEEARRRLGAVGGVRRGRRTVRLIDIVGSVGRCSEFDGVFLPLREGARTRWGRIDRAFVRGEELPPASLYEIGSSYFVLDGNHRVSVYRYHGVEFVDAEVTEFRALLPGDRSALTKLVAEFVSRERRGVGLSHYGVRADCRASSPRSCPPGMILGPSASDERARGSVPHPAKDVHACRARGRGGARYLDRRAARGTRRIARRVR